jgi:hypothetical protein
VNQPLILRPDAEADVLAIHATLEQTRHGLGAQFTRRLRDVLERIEAMPLLYGVILQDVRAARLKKFRYIHRLSRDYFGTG